jgi:hypothetical protein
MCRGGLSPRALFSSRRAAEILVGTVTTGKNMRALYARASYSKTTLTKPSDRSARVIDFCLSTWFLLRRSRMAWAFLLLNWISHRCTLRTTHVLWTLLDLRRIPVFTVTEPSPLRLPCRLQTGMGDQRARIHGTDALFSELLVCLATCSCISLLARRCPWIDTTPR